METSAMELTSREETVDRGGGSGREQQSGEHQRQSAPLMEQEVFSDIGDAKEQSSCDYDEELAASDDRTSDLIRATHSGERSVSFGDADNIHIYPLSSDNEDEKDLNSLPTARPRLQATIPEDQRPSRFTLTSERNYGFTATSRRTLVDTPQRISKTIDLETGREGARAQCAVIRDEDERFPQMRRRRLQKRAQKAMRKNSFWGRRGGDEDENENDVSNSHHDDDDERKKNLFPGRQGGLLPFKSRTHVPINDDTQYRLFSVDATVQDERGNFGFSPGFYEELMSDDDKGCACFGFKPNQMVVSYLFWAFRSSFVSLLLSAAFWFFLWTMFFATIFFALGKHNPSCIYVAGKEFGSEGSAAFMDAYSLSWTTFSTVGYGLIYPSTSKTTPNARACLAVTIICTWESFVGILIASFWGAIFLSKVTRVSSFAQVVFSSPILIRYGSGVGNGGVHEDEEEGGDGGHGKGGEESQSSGSEDEVLSKDSLVSSVEERPRISRSELSKIPCPVLEFRVWNRLSSQQHGEIIDASMNIVASVDKIQVESAKKDKFLRKKKRGGKKKGKRSLQSGVATFLDDEDLPTLEEWKQAQTKVQEMLLEARRKLTMSERFEAENEIDETNSLVSRKVFAKLEIESQEHPFFKRIWVAKHILNQESPLLKGPVKNLVRWNNNHWPRELCHAQAVRDSIKFDQILVSLSGTANADCNSVYSQKVYDYADLCVGYQFVNMLYRQHDGTGSGSGSGGDLCVDGSLINDVIEQTGGGGEVLEESDNDLVDSRSTHGQIFIL